MARNGFDFSELKEFAKKLENAEKHAQECIEEVNNEIALRLLSNVIKKTQPGVYPQHKNKVGGTLRGGWGADKVKRSSTWINERHKIYLKNDVPYASYVEFGHRTRERKDGTRGYVAPKYYLTESEKATEKIVPSVVSKKTDEFFKKYLN